MKLAATLAGRSAAGERSTWRAHVSVPRFDPHPLVDSDAFEKVALELDAEGDLEALALRGSFVHRPGPCAHRDFETRAPRAVAGNSRHSSCVSIRSRRRSPGMRACPSMPHNPHPRSWPGRNSGCRMPGPARISVAREKLAFTTARQRYAVNGMARLARGGKHSTLALRADGSGEEPLRIQELELTQLPGALSVKGNIELGKPLRWTLDARARAFDPSLFFDDWPGALDFDLATQGHRPQAGPRAHFKLTRLQGKLRARTISGSGDVALGPDLKPSGRLQLQSGGAALEAVATSGARPRIDAFAQGGRARGMASGPAGHPARGSQFARPLAGRRAGGAHCRQQVSPRRHPLRCSDAAAARPDDGRAARLGRAQLPGAVAGRIQVRGSVGQVEWRRARARNRAGRAGPAAVAGAAREWVAYRAHARQGDLVRNHQPARARGGARPAVRAGRTRAPGGVARFSRAHEDLPDRRRVSRCARPRGAIRAASRRTTRSAGCRWTCWWHWPRPKPR